MEVSWSAARPPAKGRGGRWNANNASYLYIVGASYYTSAHRVFNQLQLFSLSLSINWKKKIPFSWHVKKFLLQNTKMSDFGQLIFSLIFNHLMMISWCLASSVKQKKKFKREIIDLYKSTLSTHDGHKKKTRKSFGIYSRGGVKEKDIPSKTHPPCSSSRVWSAKDCEERRVGGEALDASAFKKWPVMP